MFKINKFPPKYIIAMKNYNKKNREQLILIKGYLMVE
jgi:hypothetical protein